MWFHHRFLMGCNRALASSLCFFSFSSTRSSRPCQRHATWLAAVILALLATACAMPQAPVYSDPLADFGAVAAEKTKYDTLRLGLIYSENVGRSMEYLKQSRDMMAALGTPQAAEDLDPNYVTDQINRVLTRTFKEVVKVSGQEEAKAQNLDAIMLFDMRAVLGSMSGEKNTVALAAVFIDPQGQGLARINAQGESVVPYPAYTFGFKNAESQAVSEFTKTLDTSEPLRIALEGLAMPKMAAAAPPMAMADAEEDLIPPSPVPPGVSFGRYYALVVGIDNYSSLPRLQTARNDAQAVANTLRTQYGYHVTLLLDATRAQVLEALGDMRKTLTDKDNLLVYYAGHGWLDADADQGYWLPVDATKDSEVNWISNDTVTGALKATLAKHVLVVADSCYSGKLTRGLRIVRRTPDYFERMAALRTRLVMSSGGLEPVADVGQGGHSVFGGAFLAALEANTGIMDGTALFSHIRRPVMLESDQTPEYADIRKAGHEGGDFLFVRR